MPERYADYNKEFPLRPLGRDEDGHKRYGCRRCGKMVPKRCRSFCGDECRRDVLVRCGTEVRHFVWERDQGWCSRCGMHTETLNKRLRDIRDGQSERYRAYDDAGPPHPHNDIRYRHYNMRPDYYEHIRHHDPRLVPYNAHRVAAMRFHDRQGKRFRQLLDMVGGPGFRMDTSLWDAHHKIAVKDGGGKCGLEGLETLCRWCHKKASAGQHKKWAAERKPDDGQLLLIGDDE